jgi:hypothetical protein
LLIGFAKRNVLWQGEAAIMKRFLFGALATVVLSGCTEKGGGKTADGPMLRVHWTGANKLKGGTNALAKALALPTTTELRDEAFAKIARTPQEFWKKSLAADAADQSAQLRPLLDDLWSNESLLELRGSPERPDVIVAVQLDDERAELWSRNLRQTANGWKMGADTPLNMGGAKGWSATGKNLSVHYAHCGKWVLAAIGHGAKAPFEGLLKPDRPMAALSNSIVEMQADWPRLNQAIPLFAQYSLPAVEMKISPRGEALRTEGRFTYPDPLPIKFEPWRIPTNLVIEPIVSFTCAQGIAPWLKKSKGFSSLALQNPPNQMCMWGLGTVHVQTYVAVPMPDPTNAVKELAPRLPDFVKAYFPTAPGQFLWASNRAEWMWSGLMMVVPHLHPERLPNGDFLVAGLFPSRGKSNSAPAELFGQVTTRTNLVYYDWELTQERLPHARKTMQLVDILNQRRISTTNSLGHRWAVDIAPFVGNSITEVTQSSPKELSFVRKSHLGLTGFELVMLTRWVEAPGFPLRYEPPPAVTVRTNRAEAAKPASR